MAGATAGLEGGSPLMIEGGVNRYGDIKEKQELF